MKILFTHLYNSNFGMGGAEKVVSDLALASRGVADSVHCAVNPSDLSELFKKKGIPVLEIPHSKRHTLRTIRLFQKLFTTFTPDVIHSHHRYMTFLMASVFKNRSTLIHTEHVLRKDKRLFFRPGDLSIAVHESVRKNLIDFFKVPEKKVVTIPNAVPPMIPDPETLKALEQQFKSLNNHFRLACVGRLEEQKGHQYMIDAVGLMPEKIRTKLMIFLAGDGSLESKLKNRVKSAGIEDCFTFLGHYSHVPELLSFCHAMVLPSLWEGLPLSVLESFSAARMVLATNIPGTSELVINQETGALVPPCDPPSLAGAIQYLMNHPDEVERMGRRAMEIWEKSYSLDRMVDQYFSYYRSQSTGRL